MSIFSGSGALGLLCVLWASPLWAQTTARSIEQNNQGFALAAQGRYAEAEALYRQALPTLTQNLDERSQINRASVLNNLGVALMHQQRLQDATAAFEQAWTLRQRWLGPQAAPTLLSRHNLAITYWSAGQTPLACQHMRQVVGGRQHTLGQNHADSQLSLNLLHQIPDCALKP